MSSTVQIDAGGSFSKNSTKSLWRRSLHHFAVHLKPHWLSLLAGWLCLLGFSITHILRPWPLKIVFDAILIPNQNLWLFKQFPYLATDSGMLLGLIAVSVLIISLMASVFSYGHTILLGTVGQKAIAAMRRQVYSHIQRLSHSFHDENQSGDLLVRMTGDISFLRELLINSVLFISERGLFIAGMIGIMMWIDWYLTLISLVILPPLAFASRSFSSKIRGASRSQRRKEGKIANTISERISAIKVVQAFTRENYEDSRFSDKESASLKAGIKSKRLEAHLSRLVEVVLAIGTCLVLWFGVHRVQAGILTPGDLLIFLAYLNAMLKPIRKIAQLTSRLAKAGACAERVVSVLDTQPAVRDAINAIKAPPFRGCIEFDRVSFSYRNNFNVMNDTNFIIKPGEHIAVVGPSGAGKSTIVNLLLRFYDPTAGRVIIDGQDIREYTLESLREQIAIVLQESVLFNSSIRENIAYGRLDASEHEIQSAAKAAGVLSFIDQLDAGFDTLVGERGKTLSGGERQRIAIARAMIRNAPILILDEPLTGLDTNSRSAVSEALERLSTGRTTLHITHDLSYAAKADRVLLLDQGQLNGFEQHHNLLQMSSLYRSLVAPEGLSSSPKSLQLGLA